MLRLDDVTVARSGLSVCRGISFSAPLGEVTVLLGANGAGKTTLLEAISGVLPVASGEITLDGRPIAKLPRDRRARAGLAHVEQGRSVFRTLTVEENLIVAAGPGPVEEVIARFPSLQRRRQTRAVHLSGGEQQMLVVARALARSPQVLLLDELSFGLAPAIVRQLVAEVRRLADEGLAIVLVEQYASLALKIGNGAHILRHGELVFSGSCADLIDDPELMRRGYLAA